MKIEEKEQLKDLKILVFANSLVSNVPTGRHESHSKIVFDTLKELNYDVHLIDLCEDPLPVKQLQRLKPDFVINLCEAIHDLSRFEPHGAALLDLLKLPFTGTDSAVLSTCQDKITVKKLFSFHQIPTPEWDYAFALNDVIRDDLRYPLIVKPSQQDNLIGITNDSVVTNEKDLRIQIERVILELGQPALVEEYIDGDELDVCMIGNDATINTLSIIRSSFDRLPPEYWKIYSMESQRGDRSKETPYELIRTQVPAKLDKKLEGLVRTLAEDVFLFLGLNDYGKVEFRVDKEGNPYVLEMNPNPPIGYDDFMTISAKASGYSYQDFIQELLFTAIQRYQIRLGIHRFPKVEHAVG